jgi:excisionase family DNA binding protein
MLIFAPVEQTLQDILTRLDQIENLVKGQQHLFKDILNAEEAAKYCSLSLKYLYQLTSKRKIPHYKNRKMLYFKKSELELWMLRTKINSMDNLEDEMWSSLNKK